MANTVLAESEKVPPLAVLDRLEQLLERQALALEGGRGGEVEDITGTIRETLAALERADPAELHSQLRFSADLRAQLERVVGAARLHHQALQNARARIGARRAVLAHCGVQWYGDRPQTHQTDSALNMTI